MSQATEIPGGASVQVGLPVARQRRRALVSWRSVYTPILAVLLVLGLWTLIKEVVPVDGVSIGSVRVLPRTDNGSLPTFWSVLSALFKPEVDIPGSQSTGITILNGFLFSLKLAAVGFGIGVLGGVLLGLAMYRSKLLERALMPYVLVVPTVPIVVVAPLLGAWTGHVSIFGEPWQTTWTVWLISAVLSFWPIPQALVRGLNSPSRQSQDLMHCLAASRRDTLLRLSLPSAVPYLLPALRISAAAAVVSAIVCEISTGTAGGIGSLILSYIPDASYDGSRLFAAVIAAAILGMAMVGVVALLELPLRRFQEREA